MCFNFRIIDMECGNQIIDRHLKTPYNALTPLQMVEYTEMEIQLAVMDRMERKARIEAERKLLGSFVDFLYKFGRIKRAT